MSANLNQGSAQIYQFPAGGRAALGGRRYEDRRQADLAASPVAEAADCSDSWYHQEAIREDKPTSKLAPKPTWEH
jgi:Protein of unknown function (DUF2735)